jgi:hypothetical protein
MSFATNNGPNPFSVVKISSLNALSPLRKNILLSSAESSTGPSKISSLAGAFGKNFSQLTKAATSATIKLITKIFS